MSNTRGEPGDMSAVLALAKIVELESVCWRDISAKRFVEQDQLAGDATMLGRCSASGHRDLTAEQLVIVVAFGFEARAEQKASKIVEVKGTVALRYSMASGTVEDVPEGLVKGFAETNGVYNAWPYWRELVQTSASRVGIHGIVAPVFRLFGKNNGQNEEQTKNKQRSEAQ